LRESTEKTIYRTNVLRYLLLIKEKISNSGKDVEVVSPVARSRQTPPPKDYGNENAMTYTSSRIVMAGREV
jgi:hypothetical protein